MPGFAPIAGSPIAAQGLSVTTYDEDLADTINGGDVAITAIFPNLADTLTATDTPTPDVLANLIGRIATQASIQTNAIFQGTAAESLLAHDTVMAAWNLLLQENVATLGEALGTVRRFAALIDALAATGQASTQMTARAACIEAVAMEGLIRQGFTPNLVDAATLSGAIASTNRMLGPLMDSVLASDSATPTMRLSMIAADSVVIDSPVTALLRANVDLADNVLIYATLRIGGTDYAGWVLNTDLKAGTQYTNTPFDSFASFRNRHYAAGPNGIVEFAGTTDDSTPIDWSLKSFLLDFGTSKWKRLPDAYIGATSDGQLVLKVITRDPGTGTQSEDWYVVTNLPAAGPGQGRVQIGRGLKSTYWQIELASIDGASLALDRIELRPLILDRRI